MPKVSIITRTCDRPLLLERAINSVLTQTFQDWEHIIVDNNNQATQAFSDLIEKYKDNYNNRLKIVQTEFIQDQGLDKLLTLGLKEASGEYFLIHDDDDSLECDFLQETVDFLEKNPKIGGICTDLNYFIENIENNEIKTLYNYPYQGLSKVSYYDIFKERNYPAPISTLLRTKIAKKINYFNNKMLKYGDREFILRFLKEAKIAKMDKNLANYHARPYGQTTYANSTLGNKAYQDNLYWEKRVIEELFKHNFDLWIFYQIVEILRPFLEKKALKKALKECIDHKTALYGAGIRAEQLFKDHQKEFKKLEIIGIFDQNQQKQGQKFKNITIYAPEEAKNLKPERILLTVANSSMVEGFLQSLIKENKLDCKIIKI